MFPKAESEPERYQGRPLVLLLENLVLDAIGKLADDEQTKMRSVVSQVFGGGDDWRTTICTAFGLETRLVAEWPQEWERQRQAALEQGVELHPIQFAKLVVDRNFADLVDPPGL